jgi:hypothetical protein
VGSATDSAELFKNAVCVLKKTETRRARRHRRAKRNESRSGLFTELGLFVEIFELPSHIRWCVAASSERRRWALNR